MMTGKYQTPRGKAATAAKQRYNEKNYDRLYQRVRKGKKDIYIATAKAAGLSLNEWIETTLDKAAGISPESDSPNKGEKI